MFRVKICGITTFEDAMQAIDAGADALGFVFYEKSPRYICLEDAQALIKKLPPFVQRIGLFVNSSPEKINATCKQCGIDIAQLHFSVDEDFTSTLQVPYLRVIRTTCKEDILEYENEYRLVDAFVESYGGEGKRVDTSWFKDVDCSKIILAGGLNVCNLDKVKSLGFYGFDVSSGVEESKGKKDPKKVTAFIQKAKD